MSDLKWLIMLKCRNPVTFSVEGLQWDSARHILAWRRERERVFNSSGLSQSRRDVECVSCRRTMNATAATDSVESIVRQTRAHLSRVSTLVPVLPLSRHSSPASVYLVWYKTFIGLLCSPPYWPAA